MKSFFSILFLLAPVALVAQVGNYSCDFEDVHENARWNIYHLYDGIWCMGNATQYGGSSSIYVSDDNGVTNATHSDCPISFAYRTLFLNSGNCQIELDHKQAYYYTYPSQWLYIFLLPANQTPVLTSEFQLPLNATSVLTDVGEYASSITWKHLVKTVNLDSAQFYKLWFVLKHTNSGAHTFTPAIDNLSIIPQPYPFNIPVSLNILVNNYIESVNIIGDSAFYYGDTAHIKVDVADHYHIVSWSNSDLPFYISPLKDSLAIYMDGNYSLSVTVAKDTHHVIVNNRGGSVPSVSNNGLIPYQESCTITANTTSSYWRFLAWSNGATANPYTFVVTGDTTMTAIYLAPNENAHRLHVVSSIPNSGIIGINGTQLLGEYYFDGNITLSATANYGYHFVQWSDGVMSNTRTINLTQDTYLTAIFAPNQYTVSLSSNDVSMGTVSGGGTFDYLSEVTISAVPSPHYHFVQWSDGNTTNPRILTLTQNTSLVAIFAQDPQYIITVTSDDPSRGSATGGGIYYAGEYATLTATANDHYYFSSWSDGVNANPYYLTVIDNASYTAFFEPIKYTVNLTTNDDYMGSVYGGGEYPYGSTADIEAQPFDGFRFIEWSDGNTISSRSLTVLEDISLQARFGDANSEGIDNVDGFQYSIKVYQGRIVVEGIDENRVQIYDVVGRQHSHNDHLQKGVYVVRIDNVITKKVVVL